MRIQIHPRMRATARQTTEPMRARRTTHIPQTAFPSDIGPSERRTYRLRLTRRRTNNSKYAQAERDEEQNNMARAE
eukprot:13482218-Ditylum_brightwellii.AAC.1